MFRSYSIEWFFKDSPSDKHITNKFETINEEGMLAQYRDVLRESVEHHRKYYKERGDFAYRLIEHGSGVIKTGDGKVDDTVLIDGSVL